jgi:hypothetical protein
MGVVVFGCQGATGPAGRDGIDGKDGNANVTATIFTFASSDLTRSFSDDRVYGLIRSIPSMTSTIIDRGVVLVYMRSASVAWQPLPLVPQGYSTTLGYDLIIGSIRLDFRSNTGDVCTNLAQIMPNPPYTVRVITMPSTTVAIALKNVDMTNSEAVLQSLKKNGITVQNTVIP